MKKILVIALIVLFATVSISFAQKKEFRFGMAMQTLQNPFYLSMKAGAEKAAAELGNVKLTIVGAEHSTDLTSQVKQIEDFIQMKMDVIGVVAIEKKGIIPTIEKVNRAGIPVITVDTDADGGKRECYIATDNLTRWKNSSPMDRESPLWKGKDRHSGGGTRISSQLPANGRVQTRD